MLNNIHQRVVTVGALALALIAAGSAVADEPALSEHGIAVAAAAAAAPAAAAAEEEEEDPKKAKKEGVEELIVTGSYIRRDNFDLPSPTQTTTEIDIELAATPDLGDIFFDQTFQVGVNANATPFEGTGADDQQWNQGQEVWANLRGLGTRATMTMMDGHRLPGDTNTWGRRTGVDVNATYPAIAIGRIETILDGAAALYGSEAIAGVINMIPKKDFEGVEVQYELQQALEDGAPSRTLSLLAGVQNDKGGAIFALELQDQERMRYTDRPDYIVSAADPWLGAQYTPWWHDAGTRSSPGDFTIPIRTAAGDLVSQSVAGQFAAVPWKTGATDNPIGHAALGAVYSRQIAEPGCAYGFGAGHDNLGTPPAAFTGTDGAGGSGRRFQDGNTTYNDLRVPGNFLNGILHAHSYIFNGGNCIMALGDMQDLQAKSQRYKGMSSFEYQVTDFLKVRGEIVFSANDYNTRDVTGGLDELNNTGLLNEQAPIVIGENPGSVFRAFADGSGLLGYTGRQDGILDWNDVNGDRIYQYLTEPGERYLFAQDANRDGIPDRDFDNDGIADTGAQRNPAAMVLMLSPTADTDGDGIPDRFDPDAGGIRFFEDVRVRSPDQLNVNPKQPRNNNVPFLRNDGGLVYLRRFTRDNIQFRVGGEFQMPESDWIVDADYTYAQGERTTQYPEPQLDGFVAALRCQAGTAGNSCWNPFSTTYLNTTPDGQFTGDVTKKFPDANDPGWRPPNAAEVNTSFENREAGIILQYNIQNFEMNVLDVIASNGNLINMPFVDEPIGIAAGIHLRLEGEQWRPNSSNAGNTGGGKIGARQTEQETEAAFAELSLPLLQSDTWGESEVQLAGRYERITTRSVEGSAGEAEFTTFIPKIALRYAPTEWVSLRGSYTEGFVTPGLYALFGEPGAFGGPGSVGSGSATTVSDYLCDFVGEIADCNGVALSGATPGVNVQAAPNPSLKAEESELYNAGVTFRLLEGDLVFDLDYTTVDFVGRVEQIGASANVRSAGGGFEDYLIRQCPGTVPDWDNPTLNPSTSGLTVDQYRASRTPAELACRLNAARTWVATAAGEGTGERGVGGSILERGLGPNGLRLQRAQDPWLTQGSARTDTLIFAATYAFEGEEIPWIGGDYGGFNLSLSVTKMLKSELTRYTSLGCRAPSPTTRLCPGDPFLAGITVDSVGSRAGTSFVGPGEEAYDPLPPTPEFRINGGVRWFNGPHSLQVLGRWHDSVTNYNLAWDELAAANRLSAANAAIPEKERCSQQPSKVCKFTAEAYFDVSYVYQLTDVAGLGDLSVNVAIRNIFDNYPKVVTTPAGHDGYLDNIMGRLGYLRVSAKF